MYSFCMKSELSFILSTHLLMYVDIHRLPLGYLFNISAPNFSRFLKSVLDASSVAGSAVKRAMKIIIVSCGLKLSFLQMNFN